MENEVVWAELEHNHGPAADVPDLVRDCRNADEEVAMNAFLDLSDRLYHQGGRVCSAASAALPLLAGLAVDAPARLRPEVVELIGRLAEEAVTVDPDLVDPAWHPALEAARPRLLALLDDPDPKVRRAATVLVADGVRHPSAVAALEARWRGETDPVTRLDLVLALGVRGRVESVHASDDLQLRLAALHASGPADAARHVDTLVRAVLHPDAVRWRDSARIRGGIVAATGALLTADPVAATAFAVEVGRAGDDDQRVAALGQVTRVASEWHATPDAVPPFLAERLDDTAPEVRYRAAALLACLREPRSADRLAALVDDPARRAFRLSTTVGDAAVWALATVVDPRCLPGLVDRLTGDRLGFTTASHHAGRGMNLMEQPGIHEVLIPLHRHADTLVGPVVARLDPVRDRVLTMSLCRVVAAWGHAAEAALPALVDLLAVDDDYVVTRAAEAVGALGPVAAGAATALRRKASVPTAAWALWRTGADPDADALLRHAAEGNSLAVEHLADIGPLAPVSLLHDLVRSADEWTRVRAAHTLWRATGDPSTPVTALAEIAEPLARGECRPVRIQALERLAEIGATTDGVRATARAITENPRRISYFGGWRAFTEDEAVRTAARTLLG